MLKALEKAGSSLNVSKCIFATNIIFHLGHIIDEKGIRPDPEKISTLINFKVNKIKSLRAFLSGPRIILPPVRPGIRVVGASIERFAEEERRMGMDSRSTGSQGRTRENICISACVGSF